MPTNHEQRYFTTGQTAKLLRVSVSTLKRWVKETPGLVPKQSRNSNGWKLFSDHDLERLRLHQKEKRRKGKNYKDSILRPVNK